MQHAGLNNDRPAPELAQHCSKFVGIELRYIFGARNGIVRCGLCKISQVPSAQNKTGCICAG